MKSKLRRAIRRVRRKVEKAGRSLVHASGRTIGIPKLRYFCPACEQPVYAWKQLRRMAAPGQSVLEPERRCCPHCQSLERHRHFSLYLSKTDVLDSRPRMLHFAPEEGLQQRLRATLGDRYVTTDLFRPGVDRKEDITKMTIEDNSFDLIYCSNILEHVEDDAAAMSELYRVLAPNGIAIIQVPIKGKTTHEDPTITDPVERYKHFGQADHVRYYGEDIAERLRAVGFVVEPFYMVDVLDLADEELKRMNIDHRELIHKCIKKEGKGPSGEATGAR